jgi:hypothetical protein
VPSMQISLSIEERPSVLRAFLERLQTALGTDARVWASLVAGDEGTPQQVDAVVHVFEAPNWDEAFRRVQPAIRRADPGKRIVRGDAAAVGRRTSFSSDAPTAQKGDRPISAPDRRRADPQVAQQQFDLC